MRVDRGPARSELSGLITEDSRWQLLSRCLRDPGIPLDVRTAGALLLLYGQFVSRLTRLTAADIEQHGPDTCLRLDTVPVLLPPQLAALVRAQLNAAPGNPDPRPLFPAAPLVLREVPPGAKVLAAVSHPQGEEETPALHAVTEADLARAAKQEFRPCTAPSCPTARRATTRPTRSPARSTSSAPRWKRCATVSPSWSATSKQRAPPSRTARAWCAMRRTKGRYAVMAMVDLAKHSDGQPVVLADIAERQAISLSYLEQLFAKLRNAGLVKSVRGPGGGYLLGHGADETRISDIILAVDEPIRATRCSPGAPMGCSGSRTRS